MADAIAITVHQLPQSLGERAAKAFDIQRFVDVLYYALPTTSKLFWGLLPQLLQMPVPALLPLLLPALLLPLPSFPATMPSSC